MRVSPRGAGQRHNRGSVLDTSIACSLLPLVWTWVRSSSSFGNSGAQSSGGKQDASAGSGYFPADEGYVEEDAEEGPLGKYGSTGWAEAEPQTIGKLTRGLCRDLTSSPGHLRRRGLRLVHGRQQPASTAQEDGGTARRARAAAAVLPRQGRRAWRSDSQTE